MSLLLFFRRWSLSCWRERWFNLLWYTLHGILGWVGKGCGWWTYQVNR